ncbi:MAG: 2Fe-2S iron-sulfur cluster-binding protein [Beijerinckiaceae bacterium]
MSDTITMRLTAIRYEAQDTHSFEFSPLDGKALPQVEPGAHIDLHLPNGMMRQYSLVTAEGSRTSYVVGVKKDRASRGGSKYIHDQLKVGQTLQVGGPRNNFPLDESASHSVLIAGGVGITPIWCMAQRLIAKGESWSMFYSCRTRAEAAFLGDLADRPEVTLHFDDESAGTFLDLGKIVAEAPEGAHFYCCGPTPMLQAYEAAAAGLPEGHMHVEYFTAAEEAATEGGYTVVLQRSGREFPIPEGKTILQVLREAGLDVTYSCEEGVCGACETAVVSGTPDHRDNILTDREREESKTMMICCSGSKSARLVLDM